MCFSALVFSQNSFWHDRRRFLPPSPLSLLPPASFLRPSPPPSPLLLPRPVREGQTSKEFSKMLLASGQNTLDHWFQARCSASRARPPVQTPTRRPAKARAMLGGSGGGVRTKRGNPGQLSPPLPLPRLLTSLQVHRLSVYLRSSRSTSARARQQPLSLANT